MKESKLNLKKKKKSKGKQLSIMRRLELTNLIIRLRLKWNINLLVKKAFLIFSWGVKLQQWRQMESQSPVFCKKNAHKNFTNFTGKNLCWSLFLIKVACQGLQKKVARVFLRTLWNFEEQLFLGTSVYLKALGKEELTCSRSPSLLITMLGKYELLQIIFFRDCRIRIDCLIKEWCRYRSIRSQMFFKIGLLKNFGIFTRKHLCWSLF